jgi:hypothetical protein
MKPLRSEQYSDRHLDCQQALELAVRYVVDHAVILGWEREEALLAVGHLAANILIGDRQNERTNCTLAGTQH